MSCPVLLAVDESEKSLRDIESELRDRYERSYRVVCLGSALEAEAELARIADAGEEVALVLAGDSLGGAPGSEFLGGVRKRHPHAQRGLLIDYDSWGVSSIGEKEIGVDHALASKRLYTDGAEVLFDYANKRGEREVMDLVVVRTQQRQFSGVVKDYLKRIHYGGDGWADSVRLPTYGNAKVVVDPKVAFGLPLVVHGGARVEDLVDRFQAGDSVAEIATDFSVPPDEVEDVIRLATRTAA